MTKKILLLTVLLICFVSKIDAQLISKVSECFELTSIVFRLAEAPEYINYDIPSYANKIDDYFSKYKDHELITFIKIIRKERGISYDAAMVAASFLEIKNSQVIIKSDSNLLKINELDARWTPSLYTSFVNGLNEFYNKTKFREFYLNNAGLYELAVQKIDSVLKKINLNWIESVIGSDFTLPQIIISLNNGAHNYGFACASEGIKKYGIVIGCGGDSAGMPTYDENKIPIIVHEILHNYTNNLILFHWNELVYNAKKIYLSVNDVMIKGAYNNSQTMLYEWFTQLLTIMYIKDNPIADFSVNYQIRNSQNQGFIWMERSVVFISHFFNKRDQFDCLKNYMFQIVGFIGNMADNIGQIKNELENEYPYVMDVFPSSGSQVKPNIDAIEIRFSQPMLDAHGMDVINDDKIMTFPIKEMPFWKDEYTFVIPINMNELEIGKIYGFILNPKFFQSTKTHSMRNTYIYKLYICE